MSSYLTFKIISVAILLVVMVVVLISRKSEKATVKEPDDKKNTDAIATEIKHKEWYLSDFAKAVFSMIRSLLIRRKNEWAAISG